MILLQTLKNRYNRYIEEAQEARQKAGLCDGLFGMGNDPRKHPCHGNFYEAVGTWVEDFLRDDPGEPECAEAAEWILKAADLNRENQDVYWYMYAAQTHALPVIEKLTREDAKLLLQWYDRAYPARDRMPTQDQVFRALKKTARPGLW